KVMGREIQMAYSAAHLAWQDAGLTDVSPEPERMGAVYGTEMIPGDLMEVFPCVQACSTNGEMDFSVWGKVFEKHIFPLWMLKYLPNMPACHVGIAVDARGPNNSIALEEASSLLALGEAADVIRRGAADMMIVGACGMRVTPTRLMYRAPGVYDQHPYDADISNGGRAGPFDRRRRGIVPSEAAVALVIESRGHAVQRGADILAVLGGHSSRFGRPCQQYGGSRQALVSAARDAMAQADITASQLAHVSAQGFSQKQLDIEEAAAIAEIAGDVPVTAYSSYFGTAGAACGLLELAASILAVREGLTLPTLGFSQPDPDCAIRVCNERQKTSHAHILKLSFTLQGQAAAVVVQCSR
ncbi:MAG: beta-ketoacyl-[acyl-carrier-protein] synthase family protein, partial [Planctomycetales bacterium]|nr:beta-ketoacyl-[acyl-carrier-protein] synthase family protein [Planctomycetales bacterium]